MSRIAKILPLPVTFRSGEMTMQNALAEKGYMRHPGTGIGIVPVLGLNGEYLTGLNPNALYIRKMSVMDKAGALREAAIVLERKERLEAETGLKLDSRSDYYSKVYDTGLFGTGMVASRVKLVDGQNVFNFSNAHKEIEFWWLSQVTDLIAPSLEHWKAGKCKSTVQFYISNPEAEASIVYKQNMTEASAVESLKRMSVQRQRQICTLLGLKVTNNDKPEMIFNTLFAVINSKVISIGDYKNQNAIELFNKISELSDKSLQVKSVVKEAIAMRLFIRKQGLIFDGEQMIAESEDALVLSLSLDSKQMEFLALETRLADKKKMKNSMEDYQYIPRSMAIQEAEEAKEEAKKLDMRRKENKGLKEE